MFVHAPEKTGITVSTMVLWDDPDLAMHAVSMCREIQGRDTEVRFRIEEVDARDLERDANRLRARACEADIVLVALHRTICELPEPVRAWFLSWSRSRTRHSGALAVLRPWDHVDGDQFRSLVHQMGDRFPPCQEREQEFREFLANCARTAHMEFFWGCLESELEEATRGLRVLEAHA